MTNRIPSSRRWRRSSREDRCYPGSRRQQADPRKNIRVFCGKPIIAYSIAAAQQTGLFDQVVVSTDDEEIATVARDFGAATPFIRPKEIAERFRRHQCRRASTRLTWFIAQANERHACLLPLRHRAAGTGAVHLAEGYEGPLPARTLPSRFPSPATRFRSSAPCASPPTGAWIAIYPGTPHDAVAGPGAGLSRCRAVLLGDRAGAFWTTCPCSAPRFDRRGACRGIWYRTSTRRRIGSRPNSCIRAINATGLHRAIISRFRRCQAAAGQSDKRLPPSNRCS